MFVIPSGGKFSHMTSIYHKHLYSSLLYIPITWWIFIDLLLNPLDIHHFASPNPPNPLFSQSSKWHYYLDCTLRLLSSLSCLHSVFNNSVLPIPLIYCSSYNCSFSNAWTVLLSSTLSSFLTKSSSASSSSLSDASSATICSTKSSGFSPTYSSTGFRKLYIFITAWIIPTVCKLVSSLLTLYMISSELVYRVQFERREPASIVCDLCQYVYMVRGLILFS